MTVPDQGFDRCGAPSGIQAATTSKPIGPLETAPGSGAALAGSVFGQSGVGTTEDGRAGLSGSRPDA